MLKIKLTNKVLLVVPKSLTYEIISLSHSEWYSGHFGIFKAIQCICNNYWSPTVKEDVTNFISTCKICGSIKIPNRSWGKMGMRKWPTAPLELISLDFLVDLPRTTKGNVHLLVINYHFTKLIELYAIKDRKASTASARLHDYILTYGIPLKILTDQDASFESKLFQELCNSLGIKKLRKSGYNLRSNGLTEQSNLTTKNYLAAFVTENKEWDCWLSELNFAYNYSIHKTTGFSPFELMFGRKARIPLDILYNYHK